MISSVACVQMRECAGKYDIPLPVLLSAESPVASPDIDVGVTLKHHQRTALRRCIDLETGNMSSERIRHVVPHWTATNIHTRLAALCDPPGAGKSHVIIALCSGTTELPSPAKKVSHCGGLLSYSLIKKRRLVRTNVVVVPHGVLAQWQGYLDACRGLEYLVFARKTDINILHLDHVLRSERPPKILLCSDKSYAVVCQMFSRH